MSEPEEIPADVMSAAIKCAETACRNLDYANISIEVDCIARAIMAATLAEREACAQIAHAEYLNLFNDAGRHLAGKIATAIRKRGGE